MPEMVLEAGWWKTQPAQGSCRGGKEFPRENHNTTGKKYFLKIFIFLHVSLVFNLKTLLLY